MRKNNTYLVAALSILFVPLTAFALTSRVSEDAGGVGGNAYSYANSQPTSMTPDGKYVLFVSYADNLGPVDLNGQMDIFLKDTTNGAIEKASVSRLGVESNGYSYTNGGTALSDDGRFILFMSYADNLVEQDTNGQADVFVRDRVNNTTNIISATWFDQGGGYGNFSGGYFVPGNGESTPRAITPDGRYVLFYSSATDLVTGSDTNNERDVFVHDTATHTTTRASTDSSGNEANAYSSPVAITPDGRYVLFSSNATNLTVSDTNGQADLFIKDMVSGVTTLVTADSNGTISNSYSEGVIKGLSSDGQKILFYSDADNLVLNDTNGQGDVFMKNISDGSITLVSADVSGNISDNYSYPYAITPDGTYALFDSYASNLTSGDTNGNGDVFVKNLSNGTVVRASTDSQGAEGYYYSNSIHITSDGRYVLFGSQGPLVPSDINGLYDTYVKDIQTNTTYLASSNDYGEAGNSDSYPVGISDDGTFVSFYGYATNLVANSTVFGIQNVFISDYKTLLQGRPIISSPSSGAYINHNDVLLQGYGDAGSDIEVILSGTVSGSTYLTSINSSGSWTITLPVLADDSYSISARQRYSSNDPWSQYTASIFTIDTVAPSSPTVVTPIQNALIDTNTTFITGTGDAGGSVTVRLGTIVKNGSIDGLGNWNVGPFTILPGYKYSIIAYQTDMAGNTGPRSDVTTIYGVTPGQTTINDSDFTADLILNKYGLSDTNNTNFASGSTTGTSADKNIRYTLQYNNLGTAYATGTTIYDHIPTNSCFTLGSIQGLDSDAVVAYSNDQGSTYTYIPSGSTGTQDCSITDIRVTFSNPFAASTYVVTDTFNGTQQNVIGNSTDGLMLSATDGVRIISTGTIKTAIYGDINNDNLLDYITVSTGGNETKYYLFDGDKYSTGVAWYTGAYAGFDPCYNNCATQLFLGDVDNDGWQDIVLGQLGSGVSLFKNNGNGFDAPIDYTMTGQAYNIWGMTDLNGDSYQDMASVAGYFMGSPSGFVGPYAGPLNPAGGGAGYQVFPLFGHLDHDGNQDIVFMGAYAESRYVFNYGTGVGFSSGYRFNPVRGSTYNGNNFIVDFDKDGRDDVILPLYNGTIYYYRNNQAGGFETGYNIAPGGFPTSPVSLYGASIGDVNNDGFIDIVGGGLNHGSKIFLGNGTGTVAAGTYVGQYFAETKPNLADIDNDGDLDLSFTKRNGYGYPMLYYRWDQNTNAYNASPAIWANQQYNIAFKDINNDQYPDIVGGWGTTQMYMLNNTIGGIEDGITGSSLVNFFKAHVSSGAYTTVLTSNGGISTWDKLLVGETLVSGANTIAYTIYPVVNSGCDMASGALISNISSINGAVDISTISGNHTSICVQAALSITHGVVGPKLHTMLATWHTDDIPAFTFDVKVVQGAFSGNTVTNTAYISSSSMENNTGNNMSTHVFQLPIVPTAPAGGFGGGEGGEGGNNPTGKTPTSVTKTPTGVIFGDKLTPFEIAKKIEEAQKPIKPIDTTKPEQPVVVVNPSGNKVVTIDTTTPQAAIQSAVAQTTSVGAGQIVEIKTQANVALQTEKQCYTPKEVVDITLGKNTTEKDLLVYQALLKSYDLTMFTNTDEYKPDNYLKRYEAAKMFVNFAKHILCREKIQTYNNQYSDIVDTDATLKPYIIEAYEYGILKGAKGLFRPLDRMNRKEFVAALMRMFTNQNMDVYGQGNDRDSEYIAAFKQYELDDIVGDDSDINRYDMSKIMYKLYYNTSYEWTDKGYVLPYGRE